MSDFITITDASSSDYRKWGISTAKNMLSLTPMSDQQTSANENGWLCMERKGITIVKITYKGVVLYSE